jgi:uncharacterized FlaG/YvyC family protein
MLCEPATLIYLSKLSFKEMPQMTEKAPDREQLIRRQAEINEQLERLTRDLRHELDRDPEEQAIEVEHDEVAVSRESNLRRELVMIEERLEEMGEL